MSVEFDEEKIAMSYNAAHTAEAQYQQAVQASNSPVKQVALLICAGLFIGGALYIPRLINPPEAEPVVYLEDLTEARMRLIPGDVRDGILLNLKSRNQFPPGAENQ